MEPNQPGQQVQIKALDNDLKGTYSNFTNVMHNKNEFIFDFILNLPPQAILTNRVIVNPALAKKITATLSESIKQYEEKFGKIEEAETPEERIGFLK